MSYYSSLALRVTNIVNARRLNEARLCKKVDECPVCMDEFIVTKSSSCGHAVCSQCCRHMKETGRTLTCPMCRDVRFKLFVELMCVCK